MDNRNERRYVKATDIRIEPSDDGNGKKLVGYAAKFESMSVLMRDFYEVITAGAFADSLAVNDVRALYNHNDDCVLGRTSAGTLKLSEDEVGLKFECQIANRSYEQDLAISIERGDITGCSFGFCVEAQSIEGESDDGYPIRRLDKIDLHEVSLGVTFPAYEDTEVALRSINRWKAEKVKEAEAKPVEIRSRKQRNKNILTILEL